MKINALFGCPPPHLSITLFDNISGTQGPRGSCNEPQLKPLVRGLYSCFPLTKPLGGEPTWPFVASRLGMLGLGLAAGSDDKLDEAPRLLAVGWMCSGCDTNSPGSGSTLVGLMNAQWLNAFVAPFLRRSRLAQEHVHEACLNNALVKPPRLNQSKQLIA